MNRIVCAACKDKYGTVICSARHYDKLMHQIIRRMPDWCGPVGVTQGFINTHGEFLTREEAWKVAEAAGQIIRRVGGDGEHLFSENLY